LLEQAPRDHATILVTAYKMPFSVKGFGNMMQSGPPAFHDVASRMARGRRRLDASQKLDVQQVRSWRSPVTRHLQKLSVTHVLLSKNAWRGRQSEDKPESEVANSSPTKWQTMRRALRFQA
jgi:hypothetical protein